MKVNFRKELEASYVDNFNSSLDILRSGEDLPTEYWEKQSFWDSAIISNPPFVHTGFHSRRYIYMKMPIFYLIECYWWLVRFYYTFKKST